MVELGPEALIDLQHYSVAAGQHFSDRAAAYAHYRKKGGTAGFNPSPFFFEEWYRWQNPNHTRYPSALAHFAAEALHRPIDPAPFIDSTAFLRRNSGYANMLEGLYALVARRDTSVSPELSAHLNDLHRAQRRVHESIRSALIGIPSGERRRLLWIQSGNAFRPAQWFQKDAPRSWDLLCNWYTLDGVDIRFGEMHMRQSGTKVTGIHHALTRHPDLLSTYEQVLFIDDDLGFEHREIDVIFEVASENSLDMFQASVAPGSQCVWPDLFMREGQPFRETSAVEIMMPGFSRRGLELCAPLFGRSVSGFGLDFACSEKIRAEGWKCGVVDAVSAEHLEVIDEKGGAYYEFMRALGINQKLELYQVMIELGKNPEFKTLRT